MTAFYVIVLVSLVVGVIVVATVNLIEARARRKLADEQAQIKVRAMQARVDTHRRYGQALRELLRDLP